MHITVGCVTERTTAFDILAPNLPSSSDTRMRTEEFEKLYTPLLKLNLSLVALNKYAYGSSSKH